MSQRAFSTMIENLGGQVLTIATPPWSSITFTGQTLRATVSFAGDHALKGGILLDELHKLDRLGGQLTAKASVVWRRMQSAPSTRLDAQVEIVLLDQDAHITRDAA